MVVMFVIVVFVVNGTFRTIPTVESNPTGREFFVPARTLIAVKQLTKINGHPEIIMPISTCDVELLISRIVPVCEPS